MNEFNYGEFVYDINSYGRKKGKIIDIKMTRDGWKYLLAYGRGEFHYAFEKDLNKEIPVPPPVEPEWDE